MSYPNFSYLEKEFPILLNIGQSAEFHLFQGPVTSLFKIRLLGERLTEKLFEEHALEFPYENSFHNRFKTLEYERVLPSNNKDLLFYIKDKGNVAVHQNKATVYYAKHGPISAFKLSKWFYETYVCAPQEISGVKFHVPENLDNRHALLVLEQEYKELEQQFKQLLEERETTVLPEEQQHVIQQKSEKAASKIKIPESVFDYDIKQISRKTFAEYLLEKEQGELSEAFWSASLPQSLDTSVASSTSFLVFRAGQVKANDKGFLSIFITVADLITHKGDIHHLFPNEYLKKNGLDRGKYNQNANSAYMQTEINIKVGSKSPAEYFQIITDQIQEQNLQLTGLSSGQELNENLKKTPFLHS
ncbi:DUF4145 domain-containing protein [Rufibacter latericius]|uniref:DUF4145 domain-containing protein n=1 Tax=Rufibacter latericius TaxID=2487040 RepID=A0A3M9MMP6_9BACT|nr:DUF4145 domain-containing protein [Rufibacter latericius]RNI26467.1 DUF4145 domain-containing protein [Rufibacter latericius]